MRYAYRNGIILDGTKNMQPLAGAMVFVEDGQITDIVSEGTPTGGREVIDLDGMYLLPGLINLHVHLALSGKPPKTDEKPVDYKKLYEMLTGSMAVRAAAKQVVGDYARTNLMSGVTTIRTVGGVLNFDAEIRDEIEDGNRIGPRIIAANTAISVPGGHFAGSIATEAASPEEAIEHVRMVAETKADLVKLMITGGVMDSSKEGEPGVLRMSPEIVKAACDEAHRLGFKVAAHVESPEGVKVALENGVDTIEHGAKLDEHTLALFKERGAVFVSTLSPFVPYAEFELSESHIVPATKANASIVMDGAIAGAKECLENGIPVGIGNDVGCPFVTHYNFWRELCYFHKYLGVSRSDTLHMATLGNATILGISARTGSIEPGKCADMIAVKGNPLSDLSALRDVSMVVARGRLIRKPRVRKMKKIDQALDRYM